MLVLVDSQNLGRSNANREFDWMKFASFHRQLFPAVRINFYTARVMDENNEVRNYDFIRKLSYNGFNVVSKEAISAQDRNGSGQRIVVKANMDAEIITDMLVASRSERIGGVLLYSGDNDFAYPIREAQRTGLWVGASGWEQSTGVELRGTVDQWIALDHLFFHFSRETPWKATQ